MSNSNIKVIKSPIIISEKITKSFELEDCNGNNYKFWIQEYSQNGNKMLIREYVVSINDNCFDDQDIPEAHKKFCNHIVNLFRNDSYKDIFSFEEKINKLNH